MHCRCTTDCTDWLKFLGAGGGWVVGLNLATMGSVPYHPLALRTTVINPWEGNSDPCL